MVLATQTKERLSRQFNTVQERRTTMKEKLVISSKKYRGDSTVISIRLPDDLISKLDSIAEDTGRTRNEIIQKCLAFSVDNLEIKEY